MATLKPVLKYPGSKATLAPWIVQHFPAHTHYLEPYCGSAAVFFAKPPSEHEILNDLNSSIVNLFRMLRNRAQTEELARLIELTPWSEEEFVDCECSYEDGPDPVENARRFLVRCWMAHGVRFRGGNGRQGFKHNGLSGHQYPALRWLDVPDRLLATVERLRGVEIRHKPAIELIVAYNHPDCLIYADPPYVRSTRNDRYYTHEMTNDEHLALLDVLDGHSGPVVLSGYAHPLYDERLAHWQRMTAPAVAEHGRERTEVLWLNAKASVVQQQTLF